MFKAEYNQLHNKPNGLYKFIPNIKHTALQTWTLKDNKTEVIETNESQQEVNF